MPGKAPNFFKKNDGAQDEVTNSKLCSEFLSFLKQAQKNTFDEPSEIGLEKSFALRQQIAFIEKKCNGNKDGSGNSFGP